MSVVSSFVRRRSAVVAVLAALLIVLAVVLADAAEDAMERRGSATLPSFSRVAVVVLENREFDQVIGNPNAPYINRLAKRYALATRFYAETHPSLPNYIAMLGGSTFGITSDCTTCSAPGWNLVDQLETHGVSWKAYMQGLPAPCYQGAHTGDYWVKHNPFMYFDTVDDDPARCHKVVPLRQLNADLSNHRLPQFVWITPDSCHDGHDCPIRTVDRFLHRRLPPLLRNLGTNGVLFLTWDEGLSREGCCKYASGGRIATIAAGPAAGRGVESHVAYDHYSMLRTIEDAWGFRELRKASCPCSHPMSGLLR